MTEEIQTEAQAPVAVEAPTSAPVARKPRASKPRAAAKGAKVAPKGKTAAKATPAKAARTPIPAGMTRSRGVLIPAATGRCGFTGAAGQCRNPGRWKNVAGQLSCSTHKGAVKRTVFAPAPKARRSRAKTQPVAAAS